MKYVLLSLQYLPAVLQAVKGVETVIGPGNGKTKKELVMDSALAVAKVGEDVDQKHVQAISALVDLTVNSLNVAGVFAKSN